MVSGAQQEQHETYMKTFNLLLIDYVPVKKIRPLKRRCSALSLWLSGLNHWPRCTLASRGFCVKGSIPRQGSLSAVWVGML